MEIIRTTKTYTNKLPKHIVLGETIRVWTCGKFVDAYKLVDSEFVVYVETDFDYDKQLVYDESGFFLLNAEEVTITYYKLFANIVSLETWFRDLNGTRSQVRKQMKAWKHNLKFEASRANYVGSLELDKAMRAAYGIRPRTAKPFSFIRENAAAAE